MGKTKLVVAAVLCTLMSVAARADMLVQFNVQIAVGPGPGGVGVATQALPIFVDIYSSPATTSNNFLSYVTSGAYNNSIIHRSIPGFVLQGGGYKFDIPGNNTSFNNVPAGSAIPLQYTLPNVRGTLAMARTTAPNSATDQFFINLVDNTATLGPAGTNPGGYAVFGNVLNAASMGNVDAIATIPVYDASSYININFASLPLTQPILSYDYFVNIPTVTELGLLGDVNNDGAVDGLDLQIISNAAAANAGGWGANNFATGYHQGDVNLDGVVDGLDVSLAVSQIPEPGTLSILALGICAVAAHRRKIN